MPVQFSNREDQPAKQVNQVGLPLFPLPAVLRQVCPQNQQPRIEPELRTLLSRE